MEEWNRNEWQGRRKDQYELSAKLVVGSFIAIIILGLVSTLI